jgi:hypothetical protein
MTPEQLLVPRYEVIAGYPGSHMYFEIGDILEWNGNYYKRKENILMAKDSVESYPHIFKPLQWWERREAGEMPEYYKYSGNHGVFKTSFRINGGIVMLNFSPTETVPVNLAYCLPATEEDYNNYINSKK